MAERMDHRFYVDWAIEDIEKGLAHLKESADESGNTLVRAVVNNIQSQINMLKKETGNQID